MGNEIINHLMYADDQKKSASVYFNYQTLRRRYTVLFARTEPADCPVHGSMVTCDMSLECPGHLKIG